MLSKVINLIVNCKKVELLYNNYMTYALFFRSNEEYVVIRNKAKNYAKRKI